MSSGKEHDIQLLIRTIRPELFRFILIEYDLFPAIQNIESLLTEAYPERSVLRLSTLDKSYREIMDSIYAQEKGIILIEDFENILADENKYIPFNQRRDKLAQYPIALIAFVPAGYHHAQTCMKRMADLWSFRSLTLNWTYTKIEQHFDAKGISSFILDNYTALDVLELENKEKEITRLEKQLAETAISSENLNLIDTLYLNLLHLLNRLEKNIECLQVAQNFLKIAEEYQYEINKPIVYAEILEYVGSGEILVNQNFILALDYYNKVLTIRIKELGEKSIDVGTVYHNIANLYYEQKKYEKALYFCKKGLKIKEKVLSNNLLNLDSTYSMMSFIYLALEKYNSALVYAKKVINIREKNLPSNHYLLAMSYHNMAYIYYILSNYSQTIHYGSLALEIAQKSFPENDPNRILIENSYQYYLSK